MYVLGQDGVGLVRQAKPANFGLAEVAHDGRRNNRRELLEFEGSQFLGRHVCS